MTVELRKIAAGDAGFVSLAEAAKLRGMTIGKRLRPVIGPLDIAGTLSEARQPADGRVPAMTAPVDRPRASLAWLVCANRRRGRAGRERIAGPSMPPQGD